MHLPSIAISPPHPYQCSPTPSLTSGPSVASSEDDLDRASFLAVPVPFPTHRPARANRKQSFGNGLDRDKFESLVRLSRDTPGLVNLKKDAYLRKEIAVKNHRGKQEERRARFMAKIGAPPSPSAIDSPATPPDSPALFHFTLPSPGLTSPLTLFEIVGQGSKLDGPTPQIRLETVDFHVSNGTRCLELPTPSRLNMRRRSLPSLADISTHFNLNNEGKAPRPRAPLPAFLHMRNPVHRISSEQNTTSASAAPNPWSSKMSISPCILQQVSHPTPTTALTEANLAAFELRAQASRGLAKLQRRISNETAPAVPMMEDDKKFRRFSAPPASFSLNNF